MRFVVECGNGVESKTCRITMFCGHIFAAMHMVTAIPSHWLEERG